MSCITEIPRAQPLFVLYGRARSDPDAVSDDALLSAIRETYWMTNATAAVSQILAIIGPACLMRPHLTEQLIRGPIEALIASGEEESGALLRAVHYLLSLSPTESYVSPDPYGRQWMVDVLPTQQTLVERVFRDVTREYGE